MLTRELLVERMGRDGAIAFLFFWGHTPKHPGKIDASCLSQWFPRDFMIDRVPYRTAEHFMMAEKARLFADEDALGEVLRAKSPADAKRVGRGVRGYVDAVWEKARFDAVVRGNVAKCGQNADLAQSL